MRYHKLLLGKRLERHMRQQKYTHQVMAERLYINTSSQTAFGKETGKTYAATIISAWLVTVENMCINT